MTKPAHRVSACLLFLILPSLAFAVEQRAVMDVQDTQVKRWNEFAQGLKKLHEQQLKRTKRVKKSKSKHQYGGSRWPLDYTRTNYYDRGSGLLLSRLEELDSEPGKVHHLEVYRYDKKGQLLRDYLVTFLPVYRNAPVQTLINFHKSEDGLIAMRQFDASDRLIYERCNGKFFDETIDMAFHDEDIPTSADVLTETVQREAYRACFEGLPYTAKPYLDPLAEINYRKMGTVSDAGLTDEQVEAHISQLNLSLVGNPNDASLYVQRANAYQLLRDFDKAIADYSRAIELSDLDDAYFGRGMARGRGGDILAGIDDLSVFIKRHPDDSHAYTKRGVRYIWAGKLDKAAADLKRAVELNEKNSEAHDDLGVIYAQRKEYDKAVTHFQQSIQHDKSYQKAYHNLALVYYLTGQPKLALISVDQSLALAPESRDSLLLKATVLNDLGRAQEAKAINEKAEFLPEGNWTERSAIQ